MCVSVSVPVLVSALLSFSAGLPLLRICAVIVIRSLHALHNLVRFLVAVQHPGSYMPDLTSWILYAGSNILDPTCQT